MSLNFQSPGVEQPLGAVAAIVEHDHDRGEFVPHEIREFHAGHLKRAVADDGHDASCRPGHVDAERRRARRSPSKCSRRG